MVEKEGRVPICLQSQVFLVGTFIGMRFSSHMASLRVFGAKKENVFWFIQLTTKQRCITYVAPGVATLRHARSSKKEKSKRGSEINQGK